MSTLDILAGGNRITNALVNNDHGGIFHDNVNVLSTSYWVNVGSLSSDKGLVALIVHILSITGIVRVTLMQIILITAPMAAVVQSETQVVLESIVLLLAYLGAPVAVAIIVPLVILLILPVAAQMFAPMVGELIRPMLTISLDVIKVAITLMPILPILAMLILLVLSFDHGACTEYCGRIYYVSKEGYRGDASQNFSQRSTGCGTYETLDESNYESICTPTYDYAGPEWQRRTSACFNSFWNDPCPLGWSHQPAYDDYEPGCYRGSHYPNPVKAYDGPSQVIGSSA